MQVGLYDQNAKSRQN
jgi:tellurite resistance protein